MSSADLRQPWWILYRGPLSSCNYSCDYCPFAKTRNTRAELADDARKLDRFVSWALTRSDRRLGVLFTPWGEALIREHYREAMVRLSGAEHVVRVAAQTNLSFGRLDWLARADLSRLAFWSTWHPSQTSMERFLGRCQELDDRGVRYSVGVVAFRQVLDQIEALRQRLAPHVYLWLNAYKSAGPGYYTDDEIERLQRIDPLFALNTRRHPSRGLPCRAGWQSFTVDGDGTARRCHFIDQPLGNVYEPDFERALRPRACTNDTCGCHIGYVHLEPLEQYPVYGDGLMERIPRGEIWNR